MISATASAQSATQTSNGRSVTSSSAGLPATFTPVHQIEGT